MTHETALKRWIIKIMIITTLTLVCLSLASGREFKPRNLPGVSHSILNLGRMDFNVYFNTKPSVSVSPKSEYEIIHPFKQIQSPRPEIEECPCQQNIPKSRTQYPTDMLSKILLNNDLFSFKDPMSSVQCCSSHEQIEEEFYIEFNPKMAPPQTPMHANVPRMSQVIPPLPPIQMPMDKIPKTMQFLPFFLDSLYANKGPQRPNSKTIEILLFPTKKPMPKPAPTKPTPFTTPEIQIVGDKETTMLYNLGSNNPSVKKDLTQDVGTGKKDMQSELLTETTTTDNHNNKL